MLPNAFFIVNFEHIAHIFLVLLLLTLNMKMLAGIISGHFFHFQIFVTFGNLEIDFCIILSHQIKKALINDHLRVSKLSLKFRIPTIHNLQ